MAFVSQYYPPEIGAPQARIHETAHAFVRRGHRVTVLTGLPNHPTGTIPPRWRGRLHADDREGGVRVLRGWLLAARNRGALRRTLGHLTCAMTTVLRGLGGAGGADVIVATSPPLFTGLAGWALARIHRRPFVLDVRDLWPDAFVDLGLAREGRAVAVFRSIERFLYRHADHVVPVTEAFSTRIGEAGVASARRTVIRNGVDLSRFDRTIEPMAAKKALGLEGRFVVLYLGAHGVAQGLDALVPAAATAGRHVTFLFVGEGAEKERIMAAAARGGGDVRFRDGVPREQVPAIYAAADVCLVSLRPTPLMETFLPSKAFEAFGASRPVVAAVAGEAKALLEAGPGAIIVPPGDAKALGAAIARLASDPARTREMGRLARLRAEAEFDRNVLADRYLHVLSDVVEAARRKRRGA